MTRICWNYKYRSDKKARGGIIALQDFELHEKVGLCVSGFTTRRPFWRANYFRFPIRNALLVLNIACTTQYRKKGGQSKYIKHLRNLQRQTTCLRHTAWDPQTFIM
jgi:hypothetical protein